MSTLIFEKPSPRQLLFLKDTHKYVAFGGARGGGKSWAVRTKAILLALAHPGITILIVRRTYPELIANHIRPMRGTLRCGQEDRIATYNDSRKEMTFGSGSVILFGYLASESDVDRYQGTEVDVLFIDEATQLSESQIKALIACVRGVNPFIKRVYLTCNPGGKGHGYIKRVYVDRDFLPGEDPEEHTFIQSKVTDNAALMAADPGYIKQLEMLPDALRKAWLDGDWDAFVGAAFPEFRDDRDHYKDRAWTHVIDDLDDIPASWKIYRGFDFGYSRPFSVVWVAIDHYGKMYHFKEWYGWTGQANVGLKLTVDEIAAGILEREKEDPRLKGRHIYGIADPAIWEKSHGESIAEMMEKAGVYFDKGDHTRLAGKMQYHYRFAFDSMGIPMFYVCKECRQFIRTIPTLIYDEKKVEDIDTDGEDHIYDAIRYIFMEHPLNPRKTEKPQRPAEDPLNLWEKR